MTTKQNTNPSGASDEQLAKNEMVGKVRGPDVDSSFHVYEFTDPETGEPLETHQTIHDVAVGTNKDGSVETEKGDKVFAIAADTKSTAAPKGPNQPNQGEAGENKKGTSR